MNKLDLKKRLNINSLDIKNNIVNYFLHNKLAIMFILLSLTSFAFARYMTLGEFFTIRSFLIDLSLSLICVAISLFFKEKNKYKFLTCMIYFFGTIQVVNVIYYKFYTSFASLSEFMTLGQTGTVVDSLFAKLSILDFVFILSPLIFYYYNKKLKKSCYFYINEKRGFRKRDVFLNGIVATVLMFFVISTSTGTDLSRLSNQWNRVSTVQRFSLLFYQLNDSFLTISPRLFSFIGYDDAAEAFHAYFDEKEAPVENEYTGILEGKNIIFVHMESVQTFLLDVNFNGVDVTPNTNKLAEEGMYFSNFFPQISTGTSSDTEFTLLSSLMPTSSGTVFVTYYNRYYQTLPKILNEQEYYTFSMHGNNFSMWNRLNAHPSLGYKNYFYEDKYDYTEEDILGLGINDLMFFEQSFDYLVEIENNNKNYMGTVITLSNHSPFTDADNFIDYDMSFKTEVEEKGDDEDAEEVEDTYNFYTSKLADYFTNVHYGDYALGVFMDMVRESDNFEDTLFVFYGDHDAKFSEKEMRNYLSYNQETGEFDLDVSYDSYDHELNKSTPLIFWTKNEELRKVFVGEYDYPMGMIDLSPTILNMYGLVNEYALGNDIFTVKDDNFVSFPSSNFLTSHIYYNSSLEEYKILKDNVILDEEYISYYLGETIKILEVSNGIIVYDLIIKEERKADEED
ncbi:MAG: LTA synthase family protein [bacterium]